MVFFICNIKENVNLEKMKNPRLSRIRHLCLMTGITFTYKLGEIKEKGKTKYVLIPAFKNHFGEGEFEILGEIIPKNNSDVEGLFNRDLIFKLVGGQTTKNYVDGRFEGTISMGNA